MRAATETPLAALEAQALDCMRRGDSSAADELWRRVVDIEPRHAAAHTQLGQNAFRRGDFAEALSAFRRSAESDGQRARPWINVALAAEQLGEVDTQASALKTALSRDPYELTALFLRGRMHERLGRAQAAARDFGAVVAVASQARDLSPELQGAVEHANQFHERHLDALAQCLDEVLEPDMQALGPEAAGRFRHSLDLMLGRRRRYDSQPVHYYVPQLPVIEFFDRRAFGWLDSIEAAHVEIRAEFESVLLEAPRGFEPYIQYGQDQPVAQWRELNHNPAWSAFHLVKAGLVVPANAERCPQTMTLWSQTPAPDQPGRTPVLLFSALQPRTRIPPHVGSSNCRLLVHLPLIVPPNCRYRVGSQWREWEQGRCLIFDDTIEHEAWNDSDQLRVVMIFDTWHPMLSAEERLLISSLSRALNRFADGESVDYGN